MAIGDGVVKIIHLEFGANLIILDIHDTNFKFCSTTFERAQLPPLALGEFFFKSFLLDARILLVLCVHSSLYICYKLGVVKK